MSADFTPTMGTYTELKPFRFWCQKVLPLVYDDTLSYYELLCKVVDYLNMTMEDVDTLHEDVEALHTAYEQLQAYVNSYFDNLNVQTEINNKLDEMAEDGTLNTLLQPTISELVGDWLEENITPTTPSIDGSLTVSGAGADAKKVGDNLAPVYNANTYKRFVLKNGVLSEDVIQLNTRTQKATNLSNIADKIISLLKNFNGYDYFNIISRVNFNLDNISFTYDDETDLYTTTGTTSAVYNLNLYAQSASFPDGLKPGDEFILDCVGSANMCYEIFFYINDSWQSGRTNIRSFYQSSIPSNAAGMLIRIHVLSGCTTTDYLSSLKCYKFVPNNIIDKIAFVLPSSVDESGNIEELLSTKKCAVLLPGTHKILNTIDMPDNTELIGCGVSSILNVADGIVGVNVGANCCLKNFKIKSEGGHNTAFSNYHAIKISGNGESSPFKGHTIIDGVTIEDFRGCGIYGEYTGYYVGNSMTVSNCKIYNCYAGIHLEKWCEFGRFTNILSYGNYIGAHCFSGNNVFVNCSFSNNQVGVYLEGDDENLSGNNGHGSVIGCTINHSNNNAGYGIIARGIANNGFLFKDCQLWYSKILVEDCAGIVIDGFEFGQNAVIESYSNTALFIMNSIFKSAPTFTVTGDAVIKRNNFTFAGVEIS